MLFNKVDEYINNPEKHLQAIHYAWGKVNEVFSYNAVRQKIEDMI